MAAQTQFHIVVKVAMIDPDQHAHMLLGFLKKPIKHLGPKGAVEELHQAIYNSSNLWLEKVADLAVKYFTRKDRLSEYQSDVLKGGLLRRLKEIRKYWIHERMEQARV